MNKLAAVLMCMGMAVAGTASAQDAMKTPDASKTNMHKNMTMQQCKDHMSTSKKDGMKKDHAMMKMDKSCEAMMKKDGGMMKDGMMKNGETKKSTPADPMPK